ncbi:MAG: preprotein translocase subunit SecE [Epsilonproteobacteria bacterium]|nr:preprotein translocase subunit SecE [Campylobacterota bacterium]
MNKVVTFCKKSVSFLTEVKEELKRVSWPDKNELIGSTIIVCVVVAIFSSILGGMDTAFGYIIRQLISY